MMALSSSQIPIEHQAHPISTSTAGPFPTVPEHQPAASPHSLSRLVRASVVFKSGPHRVTLVAPHSCATPWTMEQDRLAQSTDGEFRHIDYRRDHIWLSRMNVKALSFVSTILAQRYADHKYSKGRYLFHFVVEVSRLRLGHLLDLRWVLSSMPNFRHCTQKRTTFCLPFIAFLEEWLNGARFSSASAERFWARRRGGMTARVETFDSE